MGLFDSYPLPPSAVEILLHGINDDYLDDNSVYYGGFFPSPRSPSRPHLFW